MDFISRHQIPNGWCTSSVVQKYIIYPIDVNYFDCRNFFDLAMINMAIPAMKGPAADKNQTGLSFGPV